MSSLNNEHGNLAWRLAYLVEQVDLGDGVLLVAGVLHQEGDQPHKSIQCVEAFGSHLQKKIFNYPSFFCIIIFKI